MSSVPVFTVVNEEQARLLLDNAFLGLVYQLQREMSASQLARLTRRPLRQIHHHLTRLLNAELVEISRVEPRAGRPIKLYRAKASHYRIPFHLTDTSDVEEVLTSLYQPFIQACAFYLDRLATDLPGPDIGISILEQDEGLRHSLEAPPDSNPALQQVLAGFSLQELRLNLGHQQELARRIAELQQWIAERQQHDQVAGTAAPCLVSLLMVPGVLPRAT